MRELEREDYLQLVQALEYCVLVHDARTKEILWANQAACDLLGFTLEELKPLKATDMSGNARKYRREVGLRWLQRAVDHGSSTTEWCYRSKAGEEILTEATAIRVDLKSGPVVMVQFRDIAEDKAVERDLMRTEERMSTFLRSLDEGIVVLDEDCGVQYASESAARLLELDVSTLTGADFARYCHTESRSALRRTVAATHEGEAPSHARYRMLDDSEGGERWFATFCQFIDVEFDLRGRMLLFHDISDRVREEEQHRRDVEHLNYLARYNAMGDMAMAIAHEVSQPLAAAYNFVAGARGRLQSSPETESVLWGLSNAEKQIDRARTILTSLRQYVVGLEESKQLIDLNAIVADCAHFLELRADAKGVRLAIDYAPRDLSVRCEKVLIGQVVMNLAFNAIDEMARWPESERQVRLYTRTAGDHAELVVTDHGRGLAGLSAGGTVEGMLSTKSDGSGIGLALSQRIITRHEGRIEATENDPRGAVFTITLPLALVPQEEHEGDTTPA